MCKATKNPKSIYGRVPPSAPTVFIPTKTAAKMAAKAISSLPRNERIGAILRFVRPPTPFDEDDRFSLEGCMGDDETYVYPRPRRKPHGHKDQLTLWEGGVEYRVRSRFGEAFSALRQACTDLGGGIDNFGVEASHTRLGELEYQIGCLESFVSDYVFGERDPEDN